MSENQDIKHEDLKSNSLAEVSKIVSEYMEWYSQILRHLIYPDELDPAALPSRNTVVFTQWIKKAREQEVLGDGVYERLTSLYEEFHALIEQLTVKAKENQERLSRADFDHLTAFFEEFMTYLRRLERDSSLKDNGIDMVTGLRHKVAVNQDMAVEMERLARHGRPFCIALARLDQYDDIKQKGDSDLLMESAKRIAMYIKRCMRSFDIAYRLDDGVFLLCLKQTDINGGMAGLERLKTIMEKNDAHIVVDGEKMPLTLSCCIAEPVVGDNVETLLENLHDDLDNVDMEQGTVLEYIEISPLQRYVKSEE